jgi:hypothetical protein
MVAARQSCTYPTDVGRVRETRMWRERERGRCGDLYLPHWCRRRCPPEPEGMKQIEVVKSPYLVLVIE